MPDVVLGLLAILAVVLVRSRVRDLPQADGEPETFCAVHGVPVTDSSLRLVDRYLGRSARFRSGWTWIGIALWAVLSFAWGPTAGRTVGLAAYPPTSNIFLMGLAAWFVGLVRCETYNLRPHVHGPREASLMPRPVERYAPRRLLIHNRIAVAVSWLVVALDLVLPGPREHFDVVVVFAACVAGLVSVVSSAPSAAPCPPWCPRRRSSIGLEALLVGLQSWLLAQAPPAVATTPVRTLLGSVGFALIIWAAALALNARRQMQPWRDRSASRLQQHGPVPIR